jgi:type IV pilus assembly protein PilY1
MGDVVHSKPVYVGEPTLQWPDNSDFGEDDDRYSDFVKKITGRDGVVYVGGNDGALHGFNTDTGKEVLAYFPAHLASSDINGGYHYLTDPGYTHHYYVDGSPVVSDVYIKAWPGGSKAWRTVLIGSDRAGGKGLFALDVTDPGNFKKKNFQKARQVVLWEFSDADDPNLGYTVSEPTIALLNNGRWAAIFGNGYGNAGSGKAELFILYLDGGLDGKWSEGWDNDYFRITTGSGSPKYPNGLWTPAVIDLDGDHIADRVYAGSWWGQMWAFDLSSKYPKDWKVAHKGKPLFTAKGEIKGQNEQPITTRPQIIRHPCSSGGFEPNLLVLFGTGQYLVDADDDPYLVDSERQSFYGVWDQGDGGLHRVNLQKQVFLPGSGASGRVIAAKEVGYDGTGGSLKHGWYIDLDPGERVVSDYLVRGKAVYFNTQIPDDRLCAFGGSGWLMSVNTCDGGSPASPEFDYNGDGKLDAGDTFPIAGTLYGFAGKKFASSKGIPAAPAIIGNKRYTTGTRASGDPNTQMDVNVIADLEPGPEGRLSWDQLNP